MFDGRVCADTACVVPSLCRRVISVCVDVCQGVHYGCKDQDLHEQPPWLEVIYCQISCRFGRRHQVYLGCKGKGVRQTKYWPSGSRHIPPIPDPYALVFPIHVGAKGSNSRKWVGLRARLHTNLRQASSLSCTSVVSSMCLPAAFLRACCTCVNMPLDS